MREQRDFMRVWAGQAVSNLGDGVHRVAVLWWAKQATGSDAVVVLVALASVVPTLVAAPVAGWLVDRWPRRGLMMASDGLRLGTSAVLATAAVSGSLTTGLVVMCSALAALAGSVFDPALMASVTLLVPPERRASANSMLGANGAVAGIIGPAVGGAVIGIAGTAPALWFDAATFLVSFLLVAASRIPMPASPEASDDHHVGMAGGLDLLRQDRSVRDLVIVAAGLNFFVAPVSVLIVSLAAGPLGLGGRGYGLLEAAIPAGMVVGLVLAPRVAGRARAALYALLVTGGAIAVSAAAPWVMWAAVAFVLAGAGVGVANSIIPLSVPGAGRSGGAGPRVRHGRRAVRGRPPAGPPAHGTARRTRRGALGVRGQRPRSRGSCMGRTAWPAQPRSGCGAGRRSGGIGRVPRVNRPIHCVAYFFRRMP